MEKKKATKISGTESRNLCEGSLQQSPHSAGTKNPCPSCGRKVTTKREGVLRKHAKSKVKA